MQKGLYMKVEWDVLLFHPVYYKRDLGNGTIQLTYENKKKVLIIQVTSSQYMLFVMCYVNE